MVIFIGITEKISPKTRLYRLMDIVTVTSDFKHFCIASISGNIDDMPSVICLLAVEILTHLQLR